MIKKIITLIIIITPSMAWAQSQVCMTIPADAATSFASVLSYYNIRGERTATDADFVNNAVRDKYRALLVAEAKKAGTAVSAADADAIPELALP